VGQDHREAVNPPFARLSHSERFAGDTYDCLSRKGATQIDGVPGYATATLSLGAPATCR